jgi:outer membrane biosynthesis protein TonB
MNGHYKKEDEEKYGKRVSIFITVILHALVIACLLSFGVNSKVPDEKLEFLIDFSEEQKPKEHKIKIKPVEVKAGKEPETTKPSPRKKITLVQKSESDKKGEKNNKTREATVGKTGDIKEYEPKRRPINNKALFKSSDNRNSDSLALQTAARISKALKSGNPKGNVRSGNENGTPSAHLKGREVMGSLPYPVYEVNNEGTVVVKIMVDQYGKVINAIPGAAGTTVQDERLWTAAKKAAMKAVFNISSSAPPVQKGTITYIFKLH